MKVERRFSLKKNNYNKKNPHRLSVSPALRLFCLVSLLEVEVEVVEGKAWVLGKAARGPMRPCEEVGLGGREGIHDLGREVRTGQEGGA